MSVHTYLLDLIDLRNPEQLEEFLRMAPLLVDEVRHRKAEKIRTPWSKAVSLSAGLLLQKMVDDDQSRKEMQGQQHYTAKGLISALQIPRSGNQQVLPLQYRFGPYGKPEIIGFPLHFSLSHSGDYVLCAVSESEVGADIQQLQNTDFFKMAKRFFSAAECQALEACDSESEKKNLFFRMWTRKEAYGKLTGQGVTAVLGQEVLQTTEASAGQWKESGEVCPQWWEISVPEGYAAAVCVRTARAQTNADSREVSEGAARQQAVQRQKI